MAHLQSPNHGDWESRGVTPDTGNWEDEGKTEKRNNMNLLVLQTDFSNGGLNDSPRHHLSGGKPGSNKTESETLKRPTPLKLKHVRKLSREEGDFQRSTDSPSRFESGGRRTPFESPRHRSAGDSTPRRASRQGDRSLEVSPLHAHSHPPRLGGGGKGGGSGVSSPSWERRGSSEGGRGMIAPSTPSRSRLRPISKGDETLDHAPVVPKFGDWDETDPSSAEQFTQVFDRVRDEKQSEAGKVPVKPTESTDPNSEKHYRNESSKGCSCFPWFGK